MELGDVNEGMYSNLILICYYLICYLFLIIWGQVLSLDFHLALTFTHRQRHTHAISPQHLISEVVEVCLNEKFDQYRLIQYTFLHKWRCVFHRSIYAFVMKLLKEMMTLIFSSLNKDNPGLFYLLGEFIPLSTNYYAT